MSKTPKYVREKLIEIMSIERQKERCEVVKKLMDDFKNSNPVVYGELNDDKKELDNVRKQIDELRTRESKLSDKIRTHNRKIDKLKQEFNLSDTSVRENKGCSVNTLHPDLIEFDTNTTRLEIKILTDNEITLDDIGY